MKAINLQQLIDLDDDYDESVMNTCETNECCAVTTLATNDNLQCLHIPNH
jgi:hypothetical protein